MTYYNPYDPAFMEARRRVRARTGFYIHLSIFIAVNLFLVAIYLVTAWQINDFLYPWFLWPFGFWGIGIVAHAAGVFLRGTGVQQRMLDSELRQMGVPNRVMPPVPPATPPAPPIPQASAFQSREHVGTPG